MEMPLVIGLVWCDLFENSSFRIVGLDHPAGAHKWHGITWHPSGDPPTRPPKSRRSSSSFSFSMNVICPSVEDVSPMTNRIIRFLAETGIRQKEVCGLG